MCKARSALLRLWCARCARSTRDGQAKCILRLDARRYEEDQLRSTLDRARILEQESNYRNTAQSRNLPDVEGVVVQQNTADDCRASIGYQHLSLRLLGRDGRNAIDGTREIGLAILDVDGQKNRTGFCNLRRDLQVQ